MQCVVLTSPSLLLFNQQKFLKPPLLEQVVLRTRVNLSDMSAHRLDTQVRRYLCVAQILIGDSLVVAEHAHQFLSRDGCPLLLDFLARRLRPLETKGGIHTEAQMVQELIMQRKRAYDY